MITRERFSRKKSIAASILGLGIALSNGCSSGQAPEIKVPTPLVGSVVQLREAVSSKQTEMDVAVELAARGNQGIIAEMLLSSMDDIVPVVSQLLLVANGTPHDADAKAIASGALDLVDVARRGAAPQSLRDLCFALETRLTALEQRASNSENLPGKADSGRKPW